MASAVRYNYVKRSYGPTADVDTVNPPPTKGPTPSRRSQTLHELEILRRKAATKGDGPLLRADVEQRMRARSVRRAKVRACLDELKRLGLVTEDPKRGVMWTLHEDPRFWSRRGLVKA